MSKGDWVGLLATAFFGGWCIAWLFSGDNGVHPAPVKVELTPEVRYEIQKQVQREARKLTKPILPMVAPDKKVKVKR